MASTRDQIEELKQELTFQRVMLKSIDDNVQNRAEAEEEIRDEIKKIRRQIEELQNPGAAAAAAASFASRSSQPESSRASTAGPPGSWPNDSVNHNSASLSRTHPTPAFARQTGEMSSSASAPNTTDDPPYLLPSSNLPCRKRSLSKHLSNTLTHTLAPYDDRNNKSRRTTPSPYPSSQGDSPGTPAAPSSSDGDLDLDLFQQQKAAQERLQREKDDEHFARMLQADSVIPQSSGYPSSSTSRHTPGINAFERYQAISSNGFSNRKLPPSFKSENANGSHMGMSSMTTMRRPPVKPEPSFGNKSFSSPAQSNRNKYREVVILDSSDSEIEIVPPTAFIGNNRSEAHKAANQRAREESYAAAGIRNFPVQGMANSTLTTNNNALSRALYPGQSSRPAWMDTPVPSMLSSSSQSKMSGFADHLPFSDFEPQDDDSYPLRQSFNGTMEQYDYIMNDPRKTTEEIKNLLENIQPDMDLSAENREGTPDALQYPLYEHQKIALAWLKQMEEGRNKGGILADDMGLGKTLSSLALIVSRPSTSVAKKTTLIVGPVSLVRQWEREIQLKIKHSHRLSTRLVHGPGKKPNWDELRTFDIVLTSYGTLGAEFKRLEKWEMDQKTKFGIHYDQSPMRKLFPFLGPKSLFYRIILDEAQCVKTKSTISARACCHIKSEYRWCLTGTPMMNNVGELYSLIHFLRIKPYNEYTRFQFDFKCLSSKNQVTDTEAKRAMKKLQAVLKAILLRRTKKTMIDGKPIVDLPPKTEEIQHAVFDDDQQAFYSALESKTQIQFNKYMKAGTVGKNYSNVLVLLLRLRQCCCHPHLITDFEESPANLDISAESMLDLARGLDPVVVGRLIAGGDAFECPICYDAVQNPSIFIPCGHDTCSECLSNLTALALRENVAQGQEAGNDQSRCPECRGPIDMKKIIDYKSFKQIHLPDQVEKDDTVVAEPDGDSDTDSDTDSDSDSDIESEPDDANSDGDLRDFIVPDGADPDNDADTEDDVDLLDVDNSKDQDSNPQNARDNLDDDDLPAANEIAAKAPKRKSKAKEKKKEKHAKKLKKSKGKAKEKKSTQTLAELKKLATRSQAGRKKYMRFLRKRWQSSAKVDKCIELLERFQEGGHKTIIFSQFVSLLDLLSVPIEEKKWGFQRYDGSMSADDRNTAINVFTDRPDCKIMLISLKAGNAGLNLVAASRVIILDPFWNPFIEMQAVDRAYRIGQQNPVEVHRILIKNTVEDRIIELQDKKRTLVESALDEGASKSLSRLGPQELAFLFGVGGNN